jgi:hypothetical protein
MTKKQEPNGSCFFDYMFSLDHQGKGSGPD